MNINNKITNYIFNVDRNIINYHIANISNYKNIDSDLANNLELLLNETLSINGLMYNNIFLKYFTNISKIVFDDFFSYQFTLHQLDNRKYNETNNESILFTKLFCFSYVLKILSEKKNGKYSIKTEINSSKFFNEIVFSNICPHFSTYITDFPISNYLNNIKMKHNSNHCIVSHYINSWKFNYDNIIYRINDFSSLISVLLELKKKLFDQSNIDDILYNALFQVFYSILTMSSYKINHNDLRPSNVLIHGNYNQIDTYDLYIIKYENEVLKYYLPNIDFKVKLIDYGLTHSEIDVGLSNVKANNYLLVNEAGIYPYYSEFYDQHYFVNDIMSRKINDLSPNIYSFLETIIHSKYIGNFKNNINLCEYWRLGFPYTIKYFLSKFKDDFIIKDNIVISVKYDISQFSPTILNTILKISSTELKYDSDNKLINDPELIDNLIEFIKYVSDNKTISPSIYKLLSNPLDNCYDMILKPIDIIRKFSEFTEFTNEKPDDQILNTYELYVK
jgi:hypothetical protein